MAQQQQQGIGFEPAAEVLALDYTDDFARDLKLAAKEAALRNNYTAITTAHVMAANEAVNRRRKRPSWAEFGILLAGAAIGTGGQGFYSELSAVGRLDWLTAYVVTGVFGLLLAFFCYTRS